MTYSEEKELLNKVNNALHLCEIGDLNNLGDYLIMNSPICSYYEHSKKMLITACKNGHLNIVKYLLNAPQISYYMNTASNMDDALIYSAGNNQSEIITYLINQPNLNRDFNFETICYTSALDAAREGNLNVLKAILNVENSPNNKVPMLENGRIIEVASTEEQLEIIKYFFNTSELKNQFDKFNLFKHACNNQSFKTLNFLIYEFNIEESFEIRDFLNRKNHKDVQKMFDLRDINHELNETLSDNSTSKKKIKV